MSSQATKTPARVSAPRILVICSDRVGPEMAGTGIRAYRLARALAGAGEVTLAGIDGSSSPDGTTEVVEYSLPDPGVLKAPIARADVIVAQPHWPTVMGWARASGARLIFDLYAPEVLEALETYGGHRPSVRRLVGSLITDRLVHALHIGHHFLCASDKQRDLWTGVLLGERLLSYEAYRDDPSFDQRFLILPFGLDDEPPERRGVGPRGRFPAIGEDHEIVLWNGGIWGWFDPLLAVRGFADLHARRPLARLVFMGAATHPQAERATVESRSLARELGLLDTAVFFNDRWVPFGERASWLLDADCAVSTHTDQLETRYSFRTRLLDCFWAGLPIVCTEGDALADLVAQRGLGRTVRSGDPAALANALEAVLDDGRESYSQPLAEVAASFTWGTVTEPLVELVGSSTWPTRLGEQPGHSPMRAAQSLRAGSYRAARGALNRVGLTNWPKLGPK